MIKFGIIGLGDIARKAYLPVLSSRADIELHLYTRNQQIMAELSQKYRLPHQHSSMASLLESGIKAAFVHSATKSHEAVVETLLQNGIHVYVDKPLTFDFASSEKLVKLAEEKGLVLMLGFNRRYAPAYQLLKEVQEPNMVLMQKNRQDLPDDIRTFVFDDFVHVVDTLRYMFPYDVEELRVSGRKKGELLYHVTIQFISPEGTAIGIMNRDSGVTEEKLEVMSPTEKRVALNVADVTMTRGRTETRLSFGDWEPTLHKRGFYQMTDDFITAIQNGTVPGIPARDSLQTHEFCERIVAALNSL